MYIYIYISFFSTIYHRISLLLCFFLFFFYFSVLSPINFCLFFFCQSLGRRRLVQSSFDPQRVQRERQKKRKGRQKERQKEGRKKENDRGTRIRDSMRLNIPFFFFFFLGEIVSLLHALSRISATANILHWLTDTSPSPW